MRPSVRTVVYRGFYKESDLLTFYTDTRHASAIAGSAEVCLYAGQHNISYYSKQQREPILCVLPALPARVQRLGCGRTPKAEHLQHQAWAEICWYFPDSREQFRIAGRLTVVGEDYPDAELRKVCHVPPAPLESWRGRCACGVQAANRQPVPVSSPWRNGWDLGVPLPVLRVA